MTPAIDNGHRPISEKTKRVFADAVWANRFATPEDRAFDTALRDAMFPPICWQEEHAEAQRQLNRHYREMVDSLALSVGPRYVVKGPDTVRLLDHEADKYRYFRTGGSTSFADPETVKRAFAARQSIINAKGDKPMATRKTKAKAKAKPRRSSRPAEHIKIDEETARVRKAEADRMEHENRQRGVYDDKDVKADAPQGQSTTASKLYGGPTPSEAEATAMLTVPFLLECLGFNTAEIASVFGISEGQAHERAASGSVIAHKLGFLHVARRLMSRMKLLRENQWAEGARIAASAMQERILLALPMIVRAAYSEDMDSADPKEIIRLVKAFSPDDVVSVSQAARDLARENRSALTGTAESQERPAEESRGPLTGSVIGRAGALNRENGPAGN